MFYSHRHETSTDGNDKRSFSGFSDLISYTTYMWVDDALFCGQCLLADVSELLIVLCSRHISYEFMLHQR